MPIAGLPLGAVRTVTRGRPGSARFAVFHLSADDEVQAVEAVNAAPEFLAGRQLIGSRRRGGPAKLEDLQVSMMEVAA